MFGVVYLHTAAGSLRRPIDALWHFSNLVSSLATAAVPLFFMLSGALLLPNKKTSDLSYLLRHRLVKLAVPALVWSGVTILLTGCVKGWSTALDQLLHLPGTPVVVAYWFVYAIVPMYLLSPLLKRITDGLPKAHWHYLLALWFLFTLAQNTIYSFATGPLKAIFTEHPSLNLTMISGYLGYFLLGAFLSQLDKLPSRRFLWICMAAGIVVIAAGTAWATQTTGLYDERFKSYRNLFTALLACVLYLLFLSYGRERKSGRVLTMLSGLSFGVYLVHPLALTFWQRMWGRYVGVMVTTIPGQIILYAAVLLSCLIGVLILSSIKPLCFLCTGQRFQDACRESNLFALFQRSDSFSWKKKN